MDKNYARSNNIIINDFDLGYPEVPESSYTGFSLIKKIHQSCPKIKDFFSSIYFQEACALNLVKTICKRLYRVDYAAGEANNAYGKKTFSYLEIMRSCSSVKEFTSKYPKIAKRLSSLARAEYTIWKQSVPKRIPASRPR